VAAFYRGEEAVVGRGDGRPGDGSGKLILLFRSYKGEGGESIGCHLMRGNEAARVVLRFNYSQAATSGQ
jgi:hypothetical protein